MRELSCTARTFPQPVWIEVGRFQSQAVEPVLPSHRQELYAEVLSTIKLISGLPTTGQAATTPTLPITSIWTTTDEAW